VTFVFHVIITRLEASRRLQRLKEEKVFLGTSVEECIRHVEGLGARLLQVYSDLEAVEATPLLGGGLLI
jgi:hypothetical protein